MRQQIGAARGRQPESKADRPFILVVDDDRDTCDLLRLFLSRNYNCDHAYGGEEAMAKISANRYSVVLADLMMPKMDGYSVISSLGAMSPTTPVIIVSGIAEPDSAIRAMRIGAFDYIIKPFDPERVDVSVKRAISHHLMAEAARNYEEQLSAYAAQLEKANKELLKTLAELDSAYHATIAALATVLETRNLETRGHSDRVIAYSIRLGDELMLSEAELRALELGALFHDIGKIGVTDRVLLKPEKLNSSEWEEMKKHPEMGMRILEGITYLQPAVTVVAQHHERWDGTGYPLGLVGEQIDLKARIFAVADAIDAITSDRPYDKARSFKAAREELKGNSGKQFDPKVVDAFCRIPLEEWMTLAQKVSRL